MTFDIDVVPADAQATIEGGKVAAPAKVLAALRHVNGLFPEVTQVFYGTDGRWLFCGESFDAPAFDERVDCSLLEDAADAVEYLPAAFALRDTL